MTTIVGVIIAGIVAFIAGFALQMLFGKKNQLMLNIIKKTSTKSC